MICRPWTCILEEFFSEHKNAFWKKVCPFQKKKSKSPIKNLKILTIICWEIGYGIPPTEFATWEAELVFIVGPPLILRVINLWNIAYEFSDIAPYSTLNCRSIQYEFNSDITQLHVGQAMLVLHSCSVWGRSAGSQSLEMAPTPSLHSIVLVRIPVPQVTEHCINKKLKCTLHVEL